jgi:hypothetical protein
MNRRSFFTRLCKGVVGVAVATHIPLEWLPAPVRHRGCLTIAQITAVSYEAVFQNLQKVSNQWAESAFLRELERQGAITVVSKPIQIPLVYERNEL